MYKDPFGKEHRYPPPAGWTLKDGTVHFSAADEWAAMCRSGLEFPEYRGPSSLRGVRGDCLEPLITSRHMLRVRTVAPDEPLLDGALYVFQLGESAQSAEAAAYREKHGIATGETFVITKFARWIGTQWYAQCKDTVASLDGYGRVIAMVVAVLPLAGCEPEVAAHARQICGNPFAPESADCSQLNTDAATSMLSASVAGPVSNTYNGANANIASLTVGPYSVAVNVVLTTTGTFSVANSGATGILVTYPIGFGLNATTFTDEAAFQSVIPASTTVQSAFSFEAIHSLAANTTTTYYCNMGSGGPVSTSIAASVSNVMFKAEAIKR